MLLLVDDDDDDVDDVDVTDAPAVVVESVAVVAPNIGTSNKICGGFHACGAVVLGMLLLLVVSLDGFGCDAEGLLTGRTRSALMAAIVRALI